MKNMLYSTVPVAAHYAEGRQTKGARQPSRAKPEATNPEPSQKGSPPSDYSDQLTTQTTASDSYLVAECLKGNEEAWLALVNKYKRLIYSVPIKYGASTEDAADILQSVFM
ncbi:MAG TPA: hypothetical protein VG498_20440, partial [Terriglobales bacterium]|nr:hypothetical protein [Terriglobales bacterium]